MGGVGRVTSIGIDIGGTSVRAGVVTPDGELVAEIADRTPDTAKGIEDLLAGMVGHLRAGREVTAVGLAVAGFISADCSRVMFAPHLAWRDSPVPARLTERVGLPVVMDHDVNCAAWAEYRSGAAAGAQVSLVIAVGTGIGAGLIIDGHIYRGRFGVAPELGHLTVVPDGRLCGCGKRGCLERYCSGTALVDDVRMRIGAGAQTPLAAKIDSLTGRAVGAAARAGDTVAIEAFAELGRWLGAGMAIAADVLDPEIIVIGGGVSSAAELFLPAAEAVLKEQLTGSEYRPAPTIAVAHFGAAASAIGAALMADEHYLRRVHNRV
ncbi:MAG: ROK family protein [Nakamurella sp.]